MREDSLTPPEHARKSKKEERPVVPTKPPMSSTVAQRESRAAVAARAAAAATAEGVGGPPPVAPSRDGGPIGQGGGLKEPVGEGLGPREQRIPRERLSSVSSFSLTSSRDGRSLTKELGITIYVRKTSEFDLTNRDPRERNKIRTTLLKGEAKFTWTNPKAERDRVLAGFRKEQLNMNEISYKRVDDKVWDKLIDCCSSMYSVPNV